MSQTQSKEFKRPKNVVRLKIDGAKNAVNTLMDDDTGRGVSLVCPFPALEVDIPVQFGSKEATTKGSIHRIGVEDDPRTGLPRLRLAIRTEDAKTTVETQTGQSLLEATRVEDASPEEAPVREVVNGPMVRPLVSWADAIGRNADINLSDGVPDDEFEEGDDPEWVDCREMPLPENFYARKATRRRYRAMKHMAAAFVLGMLVAAGYLLDRSGMINLSKIMDSVVATYRDDASKAPAPEPKLTVSKAATVATQTETPAPATSDAPTPAPVETAAISPAVETSSYSTGVNPLLDDARTDESSEDAPIVASAETPTVDQEPKPPVGDADDAESVVERPEEPTNDITLNLPTRWPVEYATAYRVRDPNGVVVDVPGGLVRREGWLETGRENPLIRSVKAIQRESGARFVVYVNGDLPRFMTTPKGNAVSLRLYYDNNGEDTTTVAALNQ